MWTSAGPVPTPARTAAATCTAATCASVSRASGSTATRGRVQVTISIRPQRLSQLVHHACIKTVSPSDSASH